MIKTAIPELHSMIDARLLGNRQWLADRETCGTLNQKLVELGLQERVLGAVDTIQRTALGEEMHLDLVMVFIGLLNEWEILEVLARYGLIEPGDVARIHSLLDDCNDPEPVLRPVVQRAYVDLYNPSGLLA